MSRTDSARSESARKDIRVLVVDDDFRVGGLHREVVDRTTGFISLEPARTLAEARRSIAEHRPELLLVDVYLPDGTGIDLVRAVEIDAFVLSAANDAATVRRALTAGAVGYLVKPFDSSVLAERLDRYARFRNLMATEAPVKQEIVDRASRILHGAKETASVSRSATEQLILTVLAAGEATAAQAGERAGVSRATAQRHLAALASRGLVEVRLRYGTSGRPEHIYAVK